MVSVFRAAVRLASAPWRWWAVLWLVMLLAVTMAAGAAEEAPPTPATRLLTQADALKTADNARFAALLDEAARRDDLTAGERDYLRYLQAWQQVYVGNMDDAARRFTAIIDTSADPTLRLRATATLVNVLGTTRQYVKAFERLNAMRELLAKVSDPAARFQAMGEAAQLLNLAGQYDLATDYATRMEKALPPGEGVCRARYHALYARYRSGVAKASDPDFPALAATCDAAGQHLIANSLRGDVADMLIRDHRPDAALALLAAHQDEVRAIGYPFLTTQFAALQGKAELALGHPRRASAAAQAAVDTAGNEQQYEPLGIAYRVLYQAARHQGNMADALAWHEKLMATDSSYLNDVSARALAYQRVKQQVDARRQQVEALDAQNRILQLQQALDRKAVQASRLSIVLLLTVLASVVLWLVRLKRSQRRFMRLARHDGLTGIFNRQHFVEQAEAILAAAQRSGRPVCLVLMDLDHFKAINDSHGHAFGDLVLKRAVGVCHDHLRKTDVFGRLGGEEFGILLPDCPLAQVMERAEAIRVTIAATSDDEDTRGVMVSASLGVASSEQAGYDLRQLLADADDALYRAKRAGRNRVVVDDGCAQAVPVGV